MVSGMTSVSGRSLPKAEPERAVPPGRVGYDLDAGRLLLHTVQTARAHDVLITTGTLRPDPALADADFASAYEWMGRQMRKRLPTTGRGALWLWARTRREHLVSGCRQARGQVLLTCRVPRDRVLLSHFDGWHSVLNRGLGWFPRLPGESEDDAVTRWEKASDELDARLEGAGARAAPVRDWPADLRAEIERSWECIFDRRNYGRYDVWQATVHALYAEDVVNAVQITG
jgi:Domain of unknown function (DUF3841)